MDNYKKLSWQELQMLRDKHAGNQKLQQQLAPFEHRAYARESVSENPLNALKFAFMIPGYQAAKAVGALDSDSSTTPVSLDQFTQGFAGVGDGLMSNYDEFKKKVSRYTDSLMK